MNTALQIKRLREHRNYTQTHMADQLGISQNTYSKIESGTTKLTLERLEQIASVLEVPIETILDNDNQVFNFNNSHVEKFYGYIENLHEENKEILQQTIDLLKEQNERLLKTIEDLAKKL